MAERHSDKSPDAFRTISEVADHLDLPQHVLRFWETRFTEIRPVKRAGGRRFYRPEDVDLLRAIRHLLYAEGYTIKGVQKILKDQGARHIQTMGADLLEGRPVDVIGRAPAEVASTPKPGLLGSLLPGRRAKNEAPLIADRSGPAFDDSDLYEDPPEPARPAPAPRARAPEPARAPGRPRPEDPPMARPDAGRQAAPAPAPVRARRAADRPLEAFDPPDAFLPGFEMPQPAIDLPDERARPAAQGRAPDFEAFDDYPDDRIGREPRFDDLRADPAYRPEPPHRAETPHRAESPYRAEPPHRAESGYPSDAGYRDAPAHRTDAGRAEFGARSEYGGSDYDRTEFDRPDFGRSEFGRVDPDRREAGRADPHPRPEPRHVQRDELSVRSSGAAPSAAPARHAEPPDVWAPPPPAAPRAAPAPPLRRPTRGPASRVPEPAPLPELEDPLLPFFEDDVLTPPEEQISEPLNERIRRLREHAPPGAAEYGIPGPPEEYIPARARPGQDQRPATGRVGPLTGVFPEEAEPDDYDQAYDGEGRYPAPPRRQGPPEQYLPPHLRSEPRLAATPVHAPQPVLSRDDMHRLQSALYELGECRRLLVDTMRNDDD